VRRNAWGANGLGYRSLVQGGGKAWEIHPEMTIADGGGSADRAIGFFTAKKGTKGKAKLTGRRRFRRFLLKVDLMW
jgi:hypothetical protein